MEDLQRLRSLIREMLAEETLDEFSGVGAVAGFSLPLGMSPVRRKRKKKSKLKESTGLSGRIVGNEDFTFQNYFRYYDNEDSYQAEEHQKYYDMIGCLVRSFVNAENPFGKNRSAGIKKSLRYLQGEIKYPHEI